MFWGEKIPQILKIPVKEERIKILRSQKVNKRKRKKKRKKVVFTLITCLVLEVVAEEEEREKEEKRKKEKVSIYVLGSTTDFHFLKISGQILFFLKKEKEKRWRRWRRRWRRWRRRW